MSARTRYQELGPTARLRLAWCAFAVLLAITSVVGLWQAGIVRRGMIADATTTAEALVDSTLTPVLVPGDAVTPGGRYLTLAAAAEQTLADGTVRSVTVWAGDGTIVFAGDASLVGDQVRSMRTTVLSVLGDRPRSDVTRGLVRSFVPVELAPGLSVVVELDRSANPIASAVDPWRLLALLAAAGSVLAGVVVGRTFTPPGRRAEGFDEDTLRSALAGRSRAERVLRTTVEERDRLAAELERTQAALRETQERAREAGRVADDAPRLREHLSMTAADLERVEQERDALRERLLEAGRAVEAQAQRARVEAAGALARIEQLEGMRTSLQDRAAGAEETVARLAKQVAELQARPDVEAELGSARGRAAAAERALGAARARAETAERRNAELADLAAELTVRVRELERRPDPAARLEAADTAIEISREQIRSLTARVSSAEAEAEALRDELERERAARSAGPAPLTVAAGPDGLEVELHAEGAARVAREGRA